jgi:hypothetical protein
VIIAELVSLGLAAALGALEAARGNWDPALFTTLLLLSIVGDLAAVDTAASRVKLSSSFLAIVIAIVFLGATPAALIAVITIVASWIRDRYPRTDLLINLVTYAWFPLVAGLGFHELVDVSNLDGGDPGYYPRSPCSPSSTCSASCCSPSSAATSSSCGRSSSPASRWRCSRRCCERSTCATG